MKVLVACEYSGVVRDAFIARGHDAISCDLLPTESPGPHMICDIRDTLNLGWDLMIAHPPCTYLTRAGAKWWPKRQAEQKAAIEFVDLLWSAPISKIAIENPLGYLSYKTQTGYIWRRYDDLIQPWMFGETECKGTCLWLKNLPPLMRTLVVYERNQTLHNLPPSANRAHIRSRTFQGIANAMADQWGNLA